MQKAKKPNKQSKVGLVKIPAAFSLKTAGSAPNVKSLPNGAIRVTHREWVRSIVVPVGNFSVNMSEFVNPGYPVVFPWLSAIANNYETYRIDKLSFHYVPMVPTTTQGMVYMSLDYDTLDEAPTTVGQMMSNQSAMSGPIYSPITLRADKPNLWKWKERYTRRGVHAVNDAKTYDVGRLNFASTSGMGATPAGDVFVEYDIVLFTPQLRSTTLDESAKIISTPALASPLAPFSDKPVISGGANVSVASDTGLKFGEAGEYLVEMYAFGTNFTGVAENIGVIGDAAALLTRLYNVTNAAGTNGTSVYRLKTTVPGAILNMTAWQAVTLVNLATRISRYAASLL